MAFVSVVGVVVVVAAVVSVITVSILLVPSGVVVFGTTQEVSLSLLDVFARLCLVR